MITVAVSGYFLYPHVGHIRLIRAARKLGDHLIVIVNNDDQQRQKYGEVIVPESARLEVIGALRDVDRAVLSIDGDRSVCKTLEMLRPDVFANGGDRTSGEIPEAEVCRRLGIHMYDGAGGEKADSSSRIHAALIGQSS